MKLQFGLVICCILGTIIQAPSYCCYPIEDKNDNNFTHTLYDLDVSLPKLTTPTVTPQRRDDHNDPFHRIIGVGSSGPTKDLADPAGPPQVPEDPVGPIDPPKPAKIPSDSFLPPDDPFAPPTPPKTPTGDFGPSNGQGPPKPPKIPMDDFVLPSIYEPDIAPKVPTDNFMPSGMGRIKG